MTDTQQKIYEITEAIVSGLQRNWNEDLVPIETQEEYDALVDELAILSAKHRLEEVIRRTQNDMIYNFANTSYKRICTK